MPEISTAQVIASPGYKVGIQSPLDYSKVRRMRKDPTIALVRLMFFAGIIASDWAVEPETDEYEEAADYIREQILPSRRLLLSTAALGCFDFGWQPFEKIFEMQGMTFALKKIKPLVQDGTTIKTDDDTGAFIGFEQEKDIPLEKCLLINFDVEGTSWEGNSVMSNMEQPYDSQTTLNEAAQRFDEKMAGAHWVIHYPQGDSTFGGVETPNHVIADSILSTLKSSGSIAVPMGKAIFQELDAGSDQSNWKIELITASGASFPFADRFNYLDKLKVRGAGFPERSILEGQFGTKAEAEEHGDFVITMIEYRHQCILEPINWHLVNQMLRFQFGKSFENKVVIKNAPLNDSKRAMLRSVYDKILGNPEGYLRESELLDIDSIAETLGVPRIPIEDLV